jgi:hypothetical protein
MKADDARIEEFLKGIALPDYKSDEHARQLRAQILSRLETRRADRGAGRCWKIAALVLGLLGAGALAMEAIVQLHHYYFVGKTENGLYVFSTAPQEEGGPPDMRMAGVGGNLDAAGIEQQRKDLEEVDALRQRNARELVRVTDTQVKGNPPVRVFLYKYSLADGRPWLTSESELEGEQQQIAGLRQRGQREILKITEEEVGGQRLRMFMCRYVLSSGRAVIYTEGDPEQFGQLPLTTEQKWELVRLEFGKKGKFLGSEEVQRLGTNITFQKYSFTLADGTVVIRSEAQLNPAMCDLTAAQWDELNQLSTANSGETVDTYEEDVTGKPFKFRRAKYVLSDGTEVIQSTGKPASER